MRIGSEEARALERWAELDRGERVMKPIIKMLEAYDRSYQAGAVAMSGLPHIGLDFYEAFRALPRPIRIKISSGQSGAYFEIREPVEFEIRSYDTLNQAEAYAGHETLSIGSKIGLNELTLKLGDPGEPDIMMTSVIEENFDRRIYKFDPREHYFGFVEERLEGNVEVLLPGYRKDIPLNRFLGQT